MDAATRAALREMNRRFYDHFAADFDHRRQYPWPGWRRTVAHFEPLDRPISVLDVGCGNGRFASFLADRWPSSTWGFVGLDGCGELLDVASQRLAAIEQPTDLRLIDVLQDDLGDALDVDTDRFDLVVLFGVLHHVPGEAERRQFLRRLSTLLKAGGILAISIWRLDRNPRFSRQKIPFASTRAARERQGLPPLDCDRLEPGDALLSWSGDQEHPRYCHFPSDREIDRWIADAPPLIDRFAADGPTGQDNLYLLFSPPAE